MSHTVAMADAGQEIFISHAGADKEQYITPLPMNCHAQICDILDRQQRNCVVSPRRMPTASRLSLIATLLPK